MSKHNKFGLFGAVVVFILIVIGGSVHIPVTGNVVGYKLSSTSNDYLFIRAYPVVEFRNSKVKLNSHYSYEVFSYYETNEIDFADKLPAYEKRVLETNAPALGSIVSGKITLTTYVINSIR
jgi:hypothetical protein